MPLHDKDSGRLGPGSPPHQRGRTVAPALTPAPALAARARLDLASAQLRPAAARSAGRVQALQRAVGNRATTALLRGAEAGGGGGGADGQLSFEVQRNGGSTETRSPEQRVEDATWRGFSVWWSSADAHATAAVEAATAQSVQLSPPYSDRLTALGDELLGVQNEIANGVTFLRLGLPAPWLTTHAIARADELERRIAAVDRVTEAWSAVVSSGLLELMARFGEAQLRLAEHLRDELQECRRELETLRTALGDPKFRGAAAQTGINAAISVALLAITVTNPLLGFAIAVAGVAAQLTADQLLGPTTPGADAFTVAGVSTVGAAAERAGAAEKLGRGSARLRVAGRRLGVAGAVAASGLDVKETLQAYEEYQARVRELGQRIGRLSRRLEPLRPLLLYPQQARAMVAALRTQAARLRQGGQIVLQDSAAP
jgi:hypothetical protein